MREVLVLEHRHEMRKLIASALDECQVSFCDTIQMTSQALQKKHFDCVVLDMSIPEADGLKFLLELSANPNNHTPPVFVMSDRAQSSDKVLAYNAGADDFIEVPFDAQELKARVLSKIRKSEAHQHVPDLMHLGDITIDISKQRVWRSGIEPVDLTSLEFKLFLFLAKSPDFVYTRNQLLDQVWGLDVNVTDRTVDTHIGHLRKKLEGSRLKISTVFGAGYRLTVDREDGIAIL